MNIGAAVITCIIRDRCVRDLAECLARPFAVVRGYSATFLGYMGKQGIETTFGELLLCKLMCRCVIGDFGDMGMSITNLFLAAFACLLVAIAGVTDLLAALEELGNDGVLLSAHVAEGGADGRKRKAVKGEVEERMYRKVPPAT